MGVTQHQHTEQINEVRTAYADAGMQRDDDAYTHDMRCLSFLTSEWVDADTAKRMAELIGGYNYFNPEVAADLIDAVTDVDPDATFAVGREGSVALYVNTDIRDTVVAEVSRGAYRVDELSGGVMMNRHSHSMCRHDEPPVPNDEQVTAAGGFVRFWWD
jgi:hypothetical protein